MAIFGKSPPRSLGRRLSAMLLVVASALTFGPLRAMPAFADSVTSCDPSNIQFAQVKNISVTQEPSLNGIFSGPVSLHVTCNLPGGASVPLQGATFQVRAYSAPELSDLQATVNGDDPHYGTVLAPLSFQPPTDLGSETSDSNGGVSFKLRVYSSSNPTLWGPGGAPRLIGLHFEILQGTWLGDFGGIYATTPELGSGELLATGLLPLGLVILYRRRHARRANRTESLTTLDA